MGRQPQFLEAELKLGSRKADLQARSFASAESPARDIVPTCAFKGRALQSSKNWGGRGGIPEKPKTWENGTQF